MTRSALPDSSLGGMKDDWPSKASWKGLNPLLGHARNNRDRASKASKVLYQRMGHTGALSVAALILLYICHRKRAFVGYVILKESGKVD